MYFKFVLISLFSLFLKNCLKYVYVWAFPYNCLISIQSWRIRKSTCMNEIRYEKIKVFLFLKLSPCYGERTLLEILVGSSKHYKSKCFHSICAEKLEILRSKQMIMLQNVNVFLILQVSWILLIWQIMLIILISQLIVPKKCCDSPAPPPPISFENKFKDVLFDHLILTSIHIFLIILVI